MNLPIRGTQASLQPFSLGYTDRPAGMLSFGTFSHTMTCLLFKFSLDTDGAMYLTFVPSHTTFPNDGMRLQEREQLFPILTENSQVRHHFHRDIHVRH